MASGVPTNRTNIELPAEVSEEILQKTQDESVIMRLANRIALPGRGVEIPVITSDPEAEWVSETGMKPVSNPGLAKKVMSAYKLAVIVPFSMEFMRDTKTLYDALIQRLPKALGAKFDFTVFGGGNAPGANFDTFANAEAQELDVDAYGALVAADVDIAENGGVLNGFALAPQAKGILLSAVDKNDRPLFINNVSEGAIPRILGAPTYFGKGAFVAGEGEDVVGAAGDWTQAFYGTVEGVKIDISKDATLTYKNQSNQDVNINLFQQNMVGIRAEIELGFVADVNCFNLLTRTAASA